MIGGGRFSWENVTSGRCTLACPISMVTLSRLGLLRDAEKQFKSALGNGQFVDVYLFLAKVYVKLDQPLTALDIFKKVTKMVFHLFCLLIVVLGAGEVSR